MKHWFIFLIGFLLTNYVSLQAQTLTTQWANRAGGTATDQAYDVATDASGNVYVTGSFSGSAQFSSSVILNSNGNEDIYVAKYNANGALLWVRSAGSSGTNGIDRGRGVALDNFGNVYVAGSFSGNCVFPNNVTLTSGGERDLFVAKYTQDGAFVWARGAGGTGTDIAYDVAIDASGAVYATGSFQSSVNFGTAGVATSRGERDIWAGKWDANGNILWAGSAGGAGSDEGWSLATDGARVYITGYFSAQGGSATWGNISRTSAGSFDMFLASHDAATGAINWVQSGGGVSDDFGNSVILDPQGNLLVGGRLSGIASYAGPTSGPITLTSANNSDDALLAKYTTAGEIMFARRYGGSQTDYLHAVATDGQFIYAVGQYQSSFDFGNNNVVSSNGGFDVYIATLNNNGDVLAVRGFGGVGTEFSTGVAVRAGAVYHTGYFQNTVSFGPNVSSLTSPGLFDAFVARYNAGIPACNLIANAGADQFVGIGQSTTLTATTQNNVGNLTFNWVGPNITSNANQQSITVNPQGTGTFTYTVTVTDASNNCVASDVVVVTVSGCNLSVFAGNDQSIALNGTATLSAVASGTNANNLVYSWSGPGIQGASNTQSIQVRPTGSGTFSYTVTVTNTTNNCVASDVVLVTVAGCNLGVNVTGNTFIQRGQATTLTANAFNAQGNVTFNWSGPNGFTATGSTITVSPAATSQYVVTAVDGSSSCSSTNSVIVTVQGCLLSANITGSAANVFPGTTITLTANVFNQTGNVTFNWSGPGVTTGTNGQTITAVVGTTSTYIVNVNDDAGCNTTSAFTVFVDQFQPCVELDIPNIYPFGSATTIPLCNNASVRLFTDEKPGFTYQWWFNGEPVGPADREWTISEPGIYHVEIIRSDECRKKSEGVFITRTDATPPAVMSMDREICRESNVCLEAVGTFGSLSKELTFMWSGPAGSVFMDTRTEMMNGMPVSRTCVKPVVTTTYTVTVMDDLGCTASTLVTVTITPTPAIDVTPATQTVCVGAPISMTATPGYNFYRWQYRRISPNAQTTWSEVAFQRDPVSSNMAYQLDGNGFLEVQGQPNTYEFRAWASYEGCPIVSDTVQLVVNPLPTVTAVGGAICNGQSFTLRATNITSGRTGVAAPTVTWFVNGQSVGTGTQITVSPSFSTVYTALVDNGLCSVSSSASVTVTPRIEDIFTGNPTVSFSGNVLETTMRVSNQNVTTLQACYGAGISLFTTEVGGLSYQWETSTSPTGGFTAITGAIGSTTLIGSPNPSSSTTMTRYYRVTVRSGACGARTSGVIGITWRPIPIVATQGDAVCVGERGTVRVTNVSTLPAGVSAANVSWSWIDQSGNTIKSGTGTTLANFTFTTAPIDATTIYTLNINYPATTITDANGQQVQLFNCSTTATAVVSIGEEGPKAYAWTDRPMICAGTAVVLQGENRGILNNPAVTGNEYVYYRWDGPITDAHPAGLYAKGVVQRGSATVPSLEVRPFETSTYTLTLTAVGTLCVSTCPVTVMVGPKLVATVMHEGPADLCEGPATLTAICNSNNPNIKYQWLADYNGTGQWIAIPGATERMYMPSIGGKYNVKVWQDGMESCYDYADNWATLKGVRGDENGDAMNLITVRSKGEPIFQTWPVIICANSPGVALEARYIFGASYQWYQVVGRGSMMSYQIIPGAHNRTLVVNRPGNYVVNIVSGCVECPNYCEVWSKACPVIVVPEIRPSLNHAGSIELCNSVVELETQGSTNQYYFTWYRNGVEIPGETRNKLLITSVSPTGDDYEVLVRSIFDDVRGNACAEWSNEVEVLPCSLYAYCGEPTNVRVNNWNVTENSARVTWDQPLNNNNEDPTGIYRVRWGTSATNLGAFVTTNMKSFDLTNLTSCTEYWVAVSAVCNDGNGELFSDEVVVRFGTRGCAEPVGCPTPTTLATTNISTSAATINWTPVAGTNVIGYQWRIRRAADADFGAPVSIDGAGVGSALISGLAESTAYVVHLATRCSGGVLSAETPITFTTGGVNVECQVPVGVTIVSTTQTEVTIEWQAPSQTQAPTNYVITWALVSDGVEIGRAEPAHVDGTNTFTITNLTPGEDYIVSIRSQCSATSFSDEEFVFPTTQALGGSGDCVLISLFNSDVTASSITVGWNNPDPNGSGRVDNITLRWRETGATAFNEVTLPADQLSFTIDAARDGVTANTTYQFQVKPNGTPCDDAGIDFSTVMSVTTLDPAFAGVPQPSIASLDVECRVFDNPGTGERIILPVGILRWNAVTGADSYEVRYRPVGADVSEDVIVSDITGTSLELQSLLTVDAWYIVRIRAAIDTDFSVYTQGRFFVPNCGARTETAANVAQTINVYPNPNSGLFTVSVQATDASSAKLSVVDLTGRTVYTATQPTVAGQNDLTVDMGAVASGMYILRVEHAGTLQNVKLQVR